MPDVYDISMPPVLYTYFFLIVSSSLFYAQLNPGARQIAMANSDVAQSNDVFAVFNNPAGLAQVGWREFGIFYSPSPFGLQELAQGAFAYNEPTGIGSFSLGATTYGFELYRENRLSLAYACKLPAICLGAAVNYNNVSIKNYGAAGAVTLDLGILAGLTDYLSWGLSIHNLFHSSFGNEKDQIPQIFSSGFSYRASDEITLNASLEKDRAYPPSVRAGIEYDIIRYLALRIGLSTEPDKFTAGIGLKYSYFEFDYAVFSHQDLGITHQAGVLISFRSDDKSSHK
ncbi:MAG: hypothetical protein ACM3S2_09410 [Ignavibacteriales bacterium]